MTRAAADAKTNTTHARRSEHRVITFLAALAPAAWWSESAAPLPPLRGWDCSLPLCNALALDPMGHQAGTASAVLGFVTLAGGAALAAVFSSQVGTTAMPMVIGYTVYTSLMVVALAWARREPSVRRSGVGGGTGRSAARDPR